MLKRFVEIAAVAVAQHGSNFFDGKIGVIEQQVCFSHSRFKQKLRKRFAGLFREQPGDIDRVVAKMGGGGF